MGFRLVPKSVTLNDLERRNGRLVCVISPNWVAFGPYYAKVVEDRRIHSPSEMQPDECSFQRYITYGDIEGDHPSEGVKVQCPTIFSQIFAYNQR